nr:sensor histidine kinase [uncultured Eisenbergiella sp.]
MKRNAMGMTVFFAAVVLVAALLMFFTGSGAVSVPSENGAADLTGMDLTAQIAAVQPDGMAYYPNLHLVPGEFEGAPAPRSFTDADKSQVQFGTYRVMLRLPVGKTYALRSMAVNFAQRLWIDGVEQEAVGWPGEDAQSTDPAARTVLCVFTPQSETTEIVLQYSNFVYRGGGEAYPLYLSEYGNIIRMEQNLLFRGCLIAGCMLTIFVFYLGMYLFFQRRPYFLAFAISCLAIAIHGLLVGQKFLTRLLPQLNWYASMKLEYAALVVMIAAFILYIAGMFPGLLHKKGLWAYTGFCAVYLLVVLLTKPSLYSWGLLLFQAVSVPYGLYIIVRLFLRMRRSREAENLLILAGGCAFLLAIISESYLHSRAVHTGISGLDQPAMLVFIFANMVALAVRYARTERELSEMTELDRLKTDFINQASHDLKTPVAAMGLALQRLEDVRDETQRARFLSTARRSQGDMARLVGNLLSVARLDAGSQRYHIAPLPVEELCVKVQEKYEDALELSGVELDVSADTQGDVLCDENLLWSVLDNLVYNALRYAGRGGAIRVRVCGDGQAVSLTVSDTGPGILPEHLPHIFERGYVAGDKGGTGMGLYIVKTTIEGMGGRAEVGSAPEGGAAFTVTLPARMENRGGNT